MTEIKPVGRRRTAATASDKKPARRSQLERTAESDQRMLSAAMKLVLERGTHGTTLKEVGELAGYSRGLANFRFGSKEALFNAMLSQFNHRWKEEASAFIGDRKGIEALRGALSAVSHFSQTQASFMRAMHILNYETLASSELVRKRLHDQHIAYRTDIERYVKDGIAEGSIRKGISPERIALQFCSFVFGLVYQWLVSPELVDIGETIDDYSDALCELIARET